MIKGGAQAALVFNTVPFNNARVRIVEIAKALGLTIPQPVLARADQIIE